MKYRKLIFVFFLCTIFYTLSVTSIFAHAVVKPNTVGVAAFQTFTLGVPNEKDVPTTAVKLIIPEGLAHISPNVKPGWRIEIKKSGDGEDARITEIDWVGGTIPVGQRDEFVFSAQAPASETSLIWKAYQTYQGGQIVSWDQDPAQMKDLSLEDKEKMEPQGKGPYSITQVINDLANQPTDNSYPMNRNSVQDDGKTAKILSIVALAFSVVSLGMQVKKGRKD